MARVDSIDYGERIKLLYDINIDKTYKSYGRLGGQEAMVVKKHKTIVDMNNVSYEVRQYLVELSLGDRIRVHPRYIYDTDNLTYDSKLGRAIYCSPEWYKIEIPLPTNEKE